MPRERDRNDSKREPKDSRHRSPGRTRSEQESIYDREDSKHEAKPSSTHHRKGTGRDPRDGGALTQRATIQPPKRGETAPNRALSPSRRLLRRVGAGPVPRGAASPDLHPDLSQIISNLQAACNAARPALITAAENELLARLEDMPQTHQIYILNKILTKTVDKKQTTQLRARFDSANSAWKENNVHHSKALKKAYERVGKANYDLEQVERKTAAAQKQAAEDKKATVKKILELQQLQQLREKLAAEKAEAFKNLEEKLEEAARDQPAVVLDYLSLMKLEKMHIPRIFIRARLASMEKFCRHDGEFLRTDEKEWARESPRDQCLAICYQAYVYRRILNQRDGEVHGRYCGMGMDQEDADGHDYKSRTRDSTYTLQGWEHMMQNATNKLLPKSTNGDAIAAIEVLEANGLVDEAYHVCQVFLCRYRKQDPGMFKQKLEVLKGQIEKEKLKKRG